MSVMDVNTNHHWRPDAVARSVGVVEANETNEETAIRAALEAMNDAWARGDAAAFAGCLTEDCDYVTFDGVRTIGREANERLHRAVLDTVLLGTRLEGVVESVVLLGPDLALAHGTGAVLFPWQRTPSSRARSRQTFVLARRDRAWLVRSFQNTRVRPVPRIVASSFVGRLVVALVRFRAWIAGVPISRSFAS